MPMKVTVCFDSVRVIVPCGEGEILVRELISKAIIRYKKATGKSSGHWICVNNLKTISGGGILDPDDQLSDVVDDREQLIAIFEEQGRVPGHHHNGGDGASASSTGTASPDIFQSGESTHSGSATTSHSSVSVIKTDVVVTSKDLILGSSLTVRRGSESALNLVGLGPIQNGSQKQDIPPKDDFRESDEPHSESESEDRKYSHSNPNTLERKKNKFNNIFIRDSGRQSLSNQPDMFRWLEAAERREEKFSQERKGPVGSSSLEEESTEEFKSVTRDDEDDDIIVLINDGGPLGIHVIPDFDENGRDMGLMIQGIEKGGKVNKDGRLKEEDKIIEINGQSLLEETFKRAQAIFREAMKTKELRLKVKKVVPPLPNKPPPVLPKPKNHSPIKPSPLTLTSKTNNSSGNTDKPDSSEMNTNGNINNINNKTIKPNHLPLSRDIMPIKAGPPLKPLSPSKKTPPAVPVRHPSTSLTNENKESKEQHVFIAPTNTRKIGKKINIELKKGEVGLGFSVTSRDNMTGGEIPIYIKNILSQGAAISDGRLKPGDRLLQVNDEEMTGKTQTEAVAYLRKIPKYSMVTLVLSRQEVCDASIEDQENEEVTTPIEISPDDKMTQLSSKKNTDDGTITNLQNTEVILLDIPLNNSGATGLGVSVKGKSISTPQGTKDLGIFIKSVMPGGAAFKDGRLVINDQLLEINGEKLVGLSNIKAMEKLRNAMQQDGPIAGHTFISVARKLGAPSPFSHGEAIDTTDSPELVMQGANSAFGNKGDNSKLPITSDRTKPNNPLINRLITNLGGGSPIPPGLRNESYTRATQDSMFNDSNNSTDNVLPSSISKNKLFQSPTVHPTSHEEVIIENDAYSLPRKTQFRPRPHSTIGLPIKNDDTTSSTEDLQQLKPVPKHRQSSSLDASHQQDSDLSPEGDPAGFSREGFGRQSMSEKRKGHMDPRNTEHFWRVKSGREHRTGHARTVSNTSSNPGNSTSSNLKRSTSLEDLTVSESTLDVEEQNAMDGRMINRPRACNESFRAAVDRSYETQNTQQNPSMDTLEEESLESDAFSHGNSGNSARSSLSSENMGDGLRGKKKPTKEKKSVGIFKGFLRFGKDRKSNEEARLRSRSAERPSSEEVHLHQFQREQAWQIAQKEKFRLQEQRRIQQQQAIETHRARQQQQQEIYKHSDPYGNNTDMYGNKREQQYGANQNTIYTNRQSEIYGGKPGVYLQTDEHQDTYSSKNFPPSSSQSQVQFNSLPRPATKTEKIQQLRAEHRKRHQERQGHYPMEESEEYYERKLLEEERMRKNRSVSDSHPVYARPVGRDQPVERPNSRQGNNFMTSATNYSPHPSLSDDNEYSHASIPNKQQQYPKKQQQHPQQQQYSQQQQHPQQQQYSQQQKRPASRGYPSEQPRTLRNFSSEQPLASHGYPPSENWYQEQDINGRRMQYRAESSNNVKQFYKDPQSDYRDHGYQMYNGRRPPQSMADPGSAKV